MPIVQVECLLWIVAEPLRPCFYSCCRMRSPSWKIPYCTPTGLLSHYSYDMVDCLLFLAATGMFLTMAVVAGHGCGNGPVGNDC